MNLQCLLNLGMSESRSEVITGMHIESFCQVGFENVEGDSLDDLDY